MFYSHEVLTQRKYGVATIWLVATIGSKSGLRKVHRKDILSVNVSKACETVIQPDAPLALRLQSNLLYGISRVYSGQCDYLMSDAAMAHMNIKRLIRATTVKNLDLMSGGRSKPEQLVLHDDPAFLPDVNLTMLPDGVDLIIDDNGDLFTLDESIAISSLNLERAGSVHSLGQIGSQVGSVPGSPRHGLMIPTSDTMAGDYGFLPGGSSSLIGGDDEGDRFLDDVGFEFDANGEMREIETPKIPKAKDTLVSGDKGGKVNKKAPNVDRGSRLNSEDIAQQVLLEHAEGRGEDLSRSRMLDGDETYAPPDDDIFDIAAEPFPPASKEPSKETSKELSASCTIAEESTPSGRRRAVRTIAPIIDNVTEIRSAEMREWRENYLNNMDAAIKKSQTMKDARKAKGNAKIMLFEVGLFGELKNPLLKQLFSTKALLESLNATFEGRKRKGTEDSESKKRRIRARISGGPEEEMGLAQNLADEYELPMEGGDAVEIGDPEIEIGREGPDIGNDDIRPSSQTTLPWNLMSERRSRAGSVAMSEGRLPSVGGFPSSSAGGSQIDFPSMRRSSKLGGIKGGFERLSIIGSPIGERDEDVEEDLNREFPPGEEMEFEYFGAGANVDTQTAQDSQWLAATVEQESTNFFEFVKAEQEKSKGAAEENDEEPVDFLTFEQLLDPTQNGRIVAAQAFHHTLLLATKGLICVTQEEPYGTIQLSILEF